MTQYSSIEIAKAFSEWKNESIVLKYIEEPCVLKLLGDLSGKSVIDYGCGTGHYTRLAAIKANKVIGVDLSEHMIEYARSKSSEFKNIEYHVNDCTQVLNYGQHDIALSIYFLIYANNKDVLSKFLISMFESVKPGGICCGLTVDSNIKPNKDNYKYDVLLKRRHNDVTKIDELVVTFFDGKTGEKRFDLVNYLIDPAIIEETFKEVGFVNFKWIKMELVDEYKEKEKQFEDYFSNAGCLMYYAEKPL